jgi:hypothetical protein
MYFFGKSPVKVSYIAPIKNYSYNYRKKWLSKIKHTEHQENRLKFLVFDGDRNHLISKFIIDFGRNTIFRSSIRTTTAVT